MRATPGEGEASGRFVYFAPISAFLATFDSSQASILDFRKRTFFSTLKKGIPCFFIQLSTVPRLMRRYSISSVLVRISLSIPGNDIRNPKRGKEKA